MTTGITGLVLAGGRGTRMGGLDKGLQPFDGRPLVHHALQRLRAQTLPPQALMISANRNLPHYRALGVPVHTDASADFPGPLAGLLAGLQHAETELLLAAPCDVPRFPLSLCERLLRGLQQEGAGIAVAASVDGAGQSRIQPVFCLLRRELAGDLQRFMAEGGRSVQRWQARHARAVVPFEGPTERKGPQPFDNLNTLRQLQAQQGGRPGPG